MPSESLIDGQTALGPHQVFVHNDRDPHTLCMHVLMAMACLELLVSMQDGKRKASNTNAQRRI